MRSPRHPLIQCSSQWSSVDPTLTVECHIKWYEIWVVYPDGSVRELEDGWQEKFERDNPHTTSWGDHIPSPKFCRWLEGATGWEFDPVALDTIIGRWSTERCGS